MDVDRAIKNKFRVKRGDDLPMTGWLESRRNDLYDFFAEVGYTKGAEVGVYSGKNAKGMYQRIPKLDLTLVDPWVVFSRSRTAEQMEQVYERCRRRLRHWNPTYIRKTSLEGSKDIEDGSLDFVYIDGMHDFDHVMMDLILWTPKVRKGGIVSGHDFFFGYRSQTGVIAAVRAYTYSHCIHKWYITGGVTPWKRLTEPPSFFWVNK